MASICEHQGGGSRVLQRTVGQPRRRGTDEGVSIEPPPSTSAQLLQLTNLHDEKVANRDRVRHLVIENGY